jgi:hypothetical protein
MGYVIIPSLKLAIEISRNIEEEEYPDLTDEPFCDVHKPLKDITLSDMGNLIQYYEKVPYIDDKDSFILHWLEHRDIEYELIDEYKFEENKEKYKDYNILYF